MRRTTLAALLLYLLLSLALTYPLVLHLAGAVEDRQDALLNVWITAWDGRQLLNDPLHLFDANIFHPYPRTLAYSELLLGNGLLAMPLTAASGNPVLGYNLALLLSFVLSGLGTYLLVLALTRSPAAGFVAGLIFAFSAYRLTNLAQAQLLITQWMPFALLSLYQLLRRPRPRHLVTFVLFFCLQALSSFYYAILLALAVLGLVAFDFGASILARASRQETASKREARSAARPSSLLYLLLAAVCCALIILPFALPYFQVQRDLGFERTLADNEPFSASLRQYLMVPPGSVVHGWWLPSDDTPIAGGYPVDALFPGLVTLALALWGLIRGRGRDRWFFFFLLLAAACLSFGPRLYLAPGQPGGLDLKLPYAWLYAVVPGFKALRAPVRFDALVTLALAVLTGYGVSALLKSGKEAAGRSQSRYTRLLPAAGGALLAVLIVLESWVWPAANAVPVPVADQVPPVYRWLADQPRQPILELPLAFTPGGPQLDYQYLSTYHWHTTPDGYSGFVPPSHGQVVYEMERFPSERSVSLLQGLGVQQVVIHTSRYPAPRWREIEAALAQTADLALVQTFGTDRVYSVQPRPATPEDLAVDAYLPSRAVADQPYTAWIIAVNDGARSYAVQPTDLVRPDVTWERLDGPPQSAISGSASAQLPLVTSPHGGAAVIPLTLTAPPLPGAYRLTLHDPNGPLGEWTVGATLAVAPLAVAPLAVAPPTVAPPDDAFPVPARLEAWTAPPAAQPGGQLPVDLTWRALGKIDAYYSIYLKLLDASGNALAGWDGQPQDGEAPTLLWVPGETVIDTITLDIPAGIAPGDYTLEAGMYRAEDLARALTFDSDGRPTDHIVLGTVRVEP